MLLPALHRYSVTFTPDSQYLISGSADHFVVVWNVTDSFAHFRLPGGHSNEVNSVAASQDGRFVVSGGDDETVRVWSTRTWTEVQTLHGSGYALSVAVSADARFVLSSWSSGTVKI